MISRKSEIQSEIANCSILLKKASELEEVVDRETLRGLSDEFSDLCWDFLLEIDNIEEETEEINIQMKLRRYSWIWKIRLLLKKLNKILKNFKRLRQQIELELDVPVSKF